jgi:hypothetical protein
MALSLCRELVLRLKVGFAFSKEQSAIPEPPAIPGQRPQGERTNPKLRLEHGLGAEAREADLVLPKDATSKFP